MALAIVLIPLPSVAVSSAENGNVVPAAGSELNVGEIANPTWTVSPAANDRAVNVLPTLLFKIVQPVAFLSGISVDEILNDSKAIIYNTITLTQCFVTCSLGGSIFFTPNQIPTDERTD